MKANTRGIVYATLAAFREQGIQKEILSLAVAMDNAEAAHDYVEMERIGKQIDSREAFLLRMERDPMTCPRCDGPTSVANQPCGEC